jgi:lysophospholipase L1-like esterase
VIYERHHTVKGFDRDDRDVRRYNASADTVMRQAGVECLDLYAVIQQGGVEDCLGADGVHMTDKGNRVLAEAVAAAIENALGECKD